MNLKHGQSKTTLYRTWIELRRRCHSGKDFADWGGRGITVCERWNDFLAFANDMGPHPGAGWSIERKNNDGNYEPTNCMWIRNIHQARNRRDTRLSPELVREIRSLRGTLTVKALCDRYKVSAGAIQAVLDQRSWKEV